MPQIKPLNSQRHDIGRYIAYAYTDDDGVTWSEWDGTTDLFATTTDGDDTTFDNLEHLGTTEGELSIDHGEEYSQLKLEQTGPAVHEEYLEGEDHTFTLGVFPTPEGLKKLSPTGTGSTGFARRPKTKRQTLIIVPEQLVFDYDASGHPVEQVLTYEAGDFLKAGSALTDAEQELADMILIYWKVRFGRLSPVFRNEDGGKSIMDSLPVQAHQDTSKPSGCQIRLVMGELEDFSDDIDLEPEGS